ncbi:MAG: cell wall metabolism sensor histidine kinase WalK [Desulfobacterota bacterium]|nr:cell wall metabolism sensor histidine kinase WalK [Thermodesulfobacteriota bacterium]
MRIQIKGRGLARVGMTFFLFLLLQWGMITFLRMSFPLSSLVSLIVLTPLAYLFLMPSQKNRPPSSGPSDPSEKTGPDLLQEIFREKEYLQIILKGMTEGVLVVDGEGRIQMVNEALQRFFPLPPEVVDKTPLEVIRNVELAEAFRQALTEGKTTSFELALPSFPEKWFEVTVVPIPSTPSPSKTGRKRGGAIGVFHDISRLKKLERIRQDFVANVSHELRTPLTTIKGYAETLLEGALKEEVAYSFVEVIKKHTDRLTQIVEDLLTLSKIESKEFHLAPEPLSLSEALEEAWESIEVSARKKKISLVKPEGLGEVVVQADRKYLTQILINLLDNAIKYNREGGEVRIEVARRGGKEFQISIHDNGIGIPKEDLPRIFERFYRVDKGRSKELGGTGLGLSIVKHLVQAHGGTVWAESQLEKGSTFHFTLPCDPQRF